MVYYVEGDVLSDIEFAEGFERARNMLYATSLRILHDKLDAEDNVQEAFLSAWKHREGFKQDCKLSTWLVRITTNCALMKLRAKHSECRAATEEIPAENANLECGRVYGFRLVAGRIALQKIREAAQFSPNVQAVILCDYLGLDGPEVGRMLNMPRGSVKARVWRGRRELREVLS